MRHSLHTQFSSVQLLSHVRLFVTHELQHARPPCPSPTPRVHPNSCASSQWCHPAIWSSVVPFSSCPYPSQHQSFPMSQLFAWGGQNTGVSALASFLPKKSQDWSPSEWAGWISLQSKGFSRVFSNTILDISNSKSVNNGCSLFPKCFCMAPFFQIGQRQRLSITLSFFFI